VRRAPALLAAALTAAATLLAPPAAAARRRRACVEDAPVPVIGRSRCHAFGRWDMTPPLVDFTMAQAFEASWHRLIVDGRTFNAAQTVNHVTTFGSLAGAALGRPHVDVGTGRLLLEILRIGPARLGMAFEGGGTSLAAAPTITYGGKVYVPTSWLHGGWVADVAAPVYVGRFVLRGGMSLGGILRSPRPARPARPVSGLRLGWYVPQKCSPDPPYRALRGSFTGAVADRAGLFTIPGRWGALFLDEIAELAPERLVGWSVGDEDVERAGDHVASGLAGGVPVVSSPRAGG